jgi:hypothetical protein
MYDIACKLINKYFVENNENNHQSQISNRIPKPITEGVEWVKMCEVIRHTDKILYAWCQSYSDMWPRMSAK